MKKVFVKIYDIEWDTTVQLPKQTSAVIECDGESDLTEVISDYLSDVFGFCHFGFRYSLLTAMIAVSTEEVLNLVGGEKTISRQISCPEKSKILIYAQKPRTKADYGLCVDKEKNIRKIAKRDYRLAEKMGCTVISGKVIGEFIYGGCTQTELQIEELKIYKEPISLSEFERIDGTEVKRLTKPIIYVKKVR